MRMSHHYLRAADPPRRRARKQVVREVRSLRRVMERRRRRRANVSFFEGTFCFQRVWLACAPSTILSVMFEILYIIVLLMNFATFVEEGNYSHLIII